MGADIDIYYSHPDKKLSTHLHNVTELIRNISCDEVSQLVALFHDLDKINPNFQDKLLKDTSCGYSNHAYLSGYALLCFLLSQKDKVKKIAFAWNISPSNFILSLVVLVSKHHGDLPDFEPRTESILSQSEQEDMLRFIKRHHLPFDNYLSFALGHDVQIEDFMDNDRLMANYKNHIVFTANDYTNALDSFLRIQYLFGALVKADKIDAADMKFMIAKEEKELESFAYIFHERLSVYISNLVPTSDLNIERTAIREEALSNVDKGLDKGRQVFELTSPTGSGKTLSLLSIADKIIEKTGTKRIIYALPFLSITEQVESVIKSILKDDTSFVARIDSKSVDKDYLTLEKEWEESPSEAIYKELKGRNFQQLMFDYPLIITTFVQFFETLLSNKNEEVLRLHNFSNCIFLIDEIQSLPPRLYGFFAGYLSRFCQLHNSYAILSTATQPNFNLPKEGRVFFSHYEEPYNLVNLSHFSNAVFNRYKVNVEGELSLDSLAEKVINENASCLVILNTISDSIKLYDILQESCVEKDGILLLNTHFIPVDRKKKISIATNRLNDNKKVILISTQLIEAGVDIDFPVVYRDFTTISSLVQSAGRCNRNGKLDKGKVVLFRLCVDGQIRSQLIFRGKDRVLLDITKRILGFETYNESELLNVQRSFFNEIQQSTLFAKYGKNLENDFLKDISECMFDKIGNFTLIDKDLYGEDLVYYVPKDDIDTSFEDLLNLKDKFISSVKKEDWDKIRFLKNRLKNQIKLMSDRVVQIKLKRNHPRPLTSSDSQCYGIHKLSLSSYSFEKGIDTEGDNFL